MSTKELLNKIKPVTKSWDWLKGIFSETSPFSMMRFLSFFMFWFAIYEIDKIVNKFGQNLDSNHILLVSLLLGFSFFPKVMQKMIEKKYGSVDDTKDDKTPKEPEI